MFLVIECAFARSAMRMVRTRLDSADRLGGVGIASQDQADGGACNHAHGVIAGTDGAAGRRIS